MNTTIKYIHQLGELFEKVQLSGIFSDSKTFPDCTPKYPLELIEELHEQQKKSPDFDLKSFVLANFDLPQDPLNAYKTDPNRSITNHIELLWDVLTRTPMPAVEGSSLITLPHPYIVPGGRFREIYYWDTYFTMLGLEVSGRYDLIKNMIDNFAYLLNTLGHIPNGNRAYYIGRSQPPFFSLMLAILSKKEGEQVWVQYLPQLYAEYQFWMKGEENLSQEKPAQHRVVKMPDGEILNRFWDENDTPRPEAYKEDVALAQLSMQKPTQICRHLRAAAESGWDFSSRWFADVNKFETIHTTDIIPIDLNCLLYNLEQVLSKAYSITNDWQQAKTFEDLAINRKKAILKYCWNEELGFFFDYDFINSKQTSSYHLGACFGLFFKIATATQAQKVASVLEAKFLKSGGMLTTLENTHQQWDAPNGWAPLQWIVYRGLLNYDLIEVAKKLKINWLDLNNKVYQESQKMTEKYNVSANDTTAGGGEYPNQDGFGWSNGVYLKLSSDTNV